MADISNFRFPEGFDEKKQRAFVDVSGEIQVTSITQAQALGIYDAQIDIWHWNPITTNVMRRIYGYTWILSAFMPPLKVAPGISQPGQPIYDRNNAPIGSILVPPGPTDLGY